jgi:hypothetical protein
MSTTHDKTGTEHIDDVEAIEDKQHEAVTTFVEDTEEEKKLLRKIDAWLMPTIWILYCFSYMVRNPLATITCNAHNLQDRTNIGNARVAGMDVDIGLSSTQYFLAIVVFQVGYVIAEVPSKYVLQC